MVAWSMSPLACALGAAWHHSDIAHGADYAETACARVGIVGAVRRYSRRLAIKRQGWVSDGRLVVGHDTQGMPVSIPVGYTSGCHTLVLGATGSGKTVSEAWVACRLVEQVHGAIVIDPKGDPMLREQLAAAAEREGRRFLEWTPEGPLAYNPTPRGALPRWRIRRWRASDLRSRIICVRRSVISRMPSG
jgi:DNA helicase HerA-like ATPase